MHTCCILAYFYQDYKEQEDREEKDMGITGKETQKVGLDKQRGQGSETRMVSKDERGIESEQRGNVGDT